MADLVETEYIEAVSAVDLSALLVQPTLLPVDLGVGVVLDLPDREDVLGRQTVSAAWRGAGQGGPQRQVRLK